MSDASLSPRIFYSLITPTRLTGSGDQFPRGRIPAINKARRSYLCVVTGGDKELVIGGERACRVGAPAIASQRKRLATAPAPIDFAPVARPARFRHPIRAAEPLKGRRAIPDLREVGFSHIRKTQSRQCFGSMAGQHFPCRADIQKSPAPTAHAGLWAMCKIVRQHVIDDDHTLKAGSGGLDRRGRGVELISTGQQCSPIAQRPTVILNVSYLE